MKFKKGFLLVVLFLMVALISGCGGGGGKSDVTPVKPETDYGPFKSLTLGSEINVRDYSESGKSIYTLVTAIPSYKPEANVAPSIIYPISLVTSAFDSTVGSQYRSLFYSNFNPVMSRLYNQVVKDNSFRELENNLLAKRSRQLSKSNNINFSVVSPSIGSEWKGLHIQSIATGYWTKIDATCLYISKHGIFYVDNRDISKIHSRIVQYGDVFDRIYQINREKFGQENDVDCNGKIIIVISQEITNGTLGYFNAGDKYSSSDYKFSNQGDIIYITSDLYDTDIVFGAIAHEFQHMIYFDEHYNRGTTALLTWLNEALSQAAEYYNGFLTSHTLWMQHFLARGWMQLSLTHWTQENYGYGALFIRYIIDQFGDSVIKKMCATDKVGIMAVEQATGVDFNIIFKYFSRALVLIGTSEDCSPHYRFTSLDVNMLQPLGRKGLLPYDTCKAGDSIVGSNGEGFYPYMITFDKWIGNMDKIVLNGQYLEGTVFGLSE